MNQREWKTSRKFTDKYKWYNKTRKIQKSLKYNPDSNATVIHHLRDTEEQQKYNDEHYELWGHNLDGTFEYGKYVIFVTKEEHTKIHKCSEETRQKISKNGKGMSGKCHKKISLRLMRKARSKQSFSDETKSKLSKAMIRRWENGEFINISHERKFAGYSDEELSEFIRSLWQDDDYRAKQIIAHNWTSSFGWLNFYMQKKQKKADEKAHRSEVMKKWHSEHPVSDEFREKMRLAQTGSNNSMYGKHHTEESRRKISESNKYKTRTDEQKENMSNSQLKRYKENPVSEDTKLKMSESAKHRKSQPKRNMIQRNNARARLKIVADAYKEYKVAGGTASWNEFQKLYSSIKND